MIDVSQQLNSVERRASRSRDGEACEPPHRFYVTWEFGGRVTWIEVRLTADIADVDDDTWAQFGPVPSASAGTWMIGLFTHLGSGEIVDPTAAAAWMASAEGRSFVAQSSECWREASVEGGTPDAEADAAAERVSAAYGAAPAG